MFHACKVLALGAALVLGGALDASAADLYGGSLKDALAMAPMPAPSAGWYARIDGGYNWYTNPTIDVEGFSATTNTSIDGAWSVGGGIGRYFGRGFRGDITVDHLFDSEVNGDINCNCGGGYVGTAKFDFSSTVVLANLYYDFNRGGRFVPYIGGGVGFAHNETSAGEVDNSCVCVATIDKGSSNSFAAAAMAGVAWRIRGGETRYVGGLKDEPVAVSGGNALYMDFGYRFLYLGDVKTGDLTWNSTNVGVDPEVKNITAHEVRVGLRYDLN
jgi:opacity protein-like surface antigen